MSRAHYEPQGGGEGFYGQIPGFQGPLAQAETLEACREELASTLEDWLLFRVSRHLPIQPPEPRGQLTQRRQEARTQGF